jgi:hypothetical protein
LGLFCSAKGGQVILTAFGGWGLFSFSFLLCFAGQFFGAFFRAFARLIFDF